MGFAPGHPKKKKKQFRRPITESANLPPVSIPAFGQSAFAFVLAVERKTARQNRSPAGSKGGTASVIVRIPPVPLLVGFTSFTFQLKHFKTPQVLLDLWSTHSPGSSYLYEKVYFKRFFQLLEFRDTTFKTILKSCSQLK